MSNLQRHVPRLALEWVREHPADRWRQYDGTLCFADISGFTALAERLAQRGRKGGEELVDTLGRIFAEMMDVARGRGGSLLKFGGDALLLFFYGENHAEQASAAAVEMRKTLREAANRPTAFGPLRLSMSVGLHSGTFDLFLVGESHRELVVLGPAADTVVETESAANAGEILVSPATAGLLPRDAVRPRDDGGLLLRWRRALPPVPETRPAAPDDEQLAAGLFPAVLGHHLASAAPEPEHRVACIAFIRASDTNRMLTEEGAGALAGALQETVAAVQRVLVDEGVTLLAIDIDRDGCKFFLGAGVPFGLEDDEGVMLRALRRIMDQKQPLPLQAGVSRGHVFAAEVGGVRRAAYSAMGDTTNTAARITAKTPPGRIYAHPSVLDESLTLFEVSPAGPLTMKGKALPQLVYDVGLELGLRDREGLDAAVFIGRSAELEQIARLAAQATEERGCAIALSGSTGVGKSRLLREALALSDTPAVLALRAEPYGADNPYRMFRDPLRDLMGLERGDPARMRQNLESLVARLDPSLLPWLALIGDVVRVPVEASDEVRALAEEFRPQRTADAVVRLISAALPGPLAITVDDAHWADDVSADLLTGMEAAVAHRPWLMLVAHRDVVSGFRPKTEHQIRVGPMADTEVRRFVQVLTEAAPLRPQVISRIVSRAAGVPLFAYELVRAVRDIGSLEALPESLEAALSAQIDALDPPARQLLRYASVLGRSFSEEILAEVYGLDGQELPADLADWLDRFLEEETPGRFRFRNALLRDTVYEGLSFRLRARLHRAAGVALEKRAAEPEDIAHDLAPHFYRGEDFHKALRYSVVAGRRSKAAYANADAAALFEIALAAARRVKADDEQMAEILQALGEARERAGFVESALEAYARGLRFVRAQPLARANLLHDVGWAKKRAGRLSSALRSVTQGVSLLADQESPEAQRAKARLESLRATLFFVQDRPAKALAAAEAAAGTARSGGEREALVRALNVMETAQLVLNGRSDGEYLKEALAIADELGNRAQQAMLSSTLSALLFYGNRWNEAIDSYRAAHKLYEQAGNFLEGAYMLVNLGEILSRQGRLAEAREALLEALQVMRASDFQEGIANTEMELARVAMMTGDLTEAETLCERAIEGFEALNARHFVLQARLIRAEVLLRRGTAEDALEEVDGAVRAAGREAGYLQTKVSTTRARVLTALERYADAAAEIDAGLAVASGQGMDHDQAVLLRLRDEVSRLQGTGGRPDDLARAESILATLGVVS
ncbi:MAG TPA: adenylate/guanylate cyclase domain-containing protein [Pseudomonadales bacterium]